MFEERVAVRLAVEHVDVSVRGSAGIRAAQDNRSKMRNIRDLFFPVFAFPPDFTPDAYGA